MRLLRLMVVASYVSMAAAHANETSSVVGPANADVEQGSEMPKIIERELTPNTGEYMRTPCYKTERYCTEWLPDGKCKLWDSKQVQVSC